MIVLKETFFEDNPINNEIGMCELKYVDTTRQKADGFTKALARVQFAQSIGKWNLRREVSREGVSF